MNRTFYIASCKFTVDHPGLSFTIQRYIMERFGYDIVRCCLKNYKTKEFSQLLPEHYRALWDSIPNGGAFDDTDTIISVCHNCSARIEEMRPNIRRASLWEIILSDESFDYPDYRGQKIILQDCFRARSNHSEHEAVRALLLKMNFSIIELAACRDLADFCEVTRYRRQPAANIKLAPKRFVENAGDWFCEKTEEDQTSLMKHYVNVLPHYPVAAYCHYCSAGLKTGGASVFHLASLLFEADKIKALLKKIPTVKVDG